MKLVAQIGLAVMLSIVTTFAQEMRSATDTGQEPIQGKSRTEVVDELWRMAAKGDLLTPDGWSKASGFFTAPMPFSGDKVIRVMSNDWGPAYEYKSKDNSTDVELGYIDMGKIDSKLNYTAPQKTEFVKTGFLYHLVAVPAYSTMSSASGQVSKKPVGARFWQIQGSPGLPWTTVNTAIRYVLEMREKTSDPTIKKNADETLAKLLRLH